MSERIHGEDLRQLMRFVPSPVAVLTFRSNDGPRGVTIGSFTSVSLDPPLISFNLMSGGNAQTWLDKSDYFAVHILRDDQAKISEHFAIPELSSDMQFGTIDYYNTAEGVPILKDCVAVVECCLYDILVAGDHSLILGKVTRAKLQHPGNPLLYFKRAYHEIGNPVR